MPEGGGTRFTDLPSGPVTFQPQVVHYIPNPNPNPSVFHGPAERVALCPHPTPVPLIYPSSLSQCPHPTPVPPSQAGKAILWPSVLADQPHEKDERTNHEALPVTSGEKYGGAPHRAASAGTRRCLDSHFGTHV